MQPAQIDELSTKSFPMCMRAMHKKLRATHHLKHTARMQYGLFLKGIGLSLENALVFWRSEFTRNMAPEVFDKAYPLCGDWPFSFLKHTKYAIILVQVALEVANIPSDSHYQIYVRFLVSNFDS